MELNPWKAPAQTSGPFATAPTNQQDTFNSSTPMPRNLALFFDGTWNTPGDETNVRRLFRLTAARDSYQCKLLSRSAAKEASHTPDQLGEVEQLKYYHKGVGTTWSSRILGGMFGAGLSKNIRDGLVWLANHYRENDRIYIFGFSRGAYTARSLVGLINKCGIPRLPSGPCSQRTVKGLVATAYHIYREGQWTKDAFQAKGFRQTYCWPDVKIKFIGVWDTVGALGLPVHEIWFGSDYYRFHDTQLSDIVDNAFHAVAVDEHRPDFAATMWDASTKLREGQRVEQRWFPGAHADVGGGYSKGRLYQAPLRWMQEMATQCGLTFKAKVDVDAEAFLSPMHDSLSEFAFGLYALLPWIFDNYRPRGTGVNEIIDESVKKRQAAPEGLDATKARYNPPGL